MRHRASTGPAVVRSDGAYCTYAIKQNTTSVTGNLLRFFVFTETASVSVLPRWNWAWFVGADLTLLTDHQRITCVTATVDPHATFFAALIARHLERSLMNV